MIQGNTTMQSNMMHGCPMMSGGGMAMMIAMGVIWILIIAALLLSIAALIKYLRSGRNS